MAELEQLTENIQEIIRSISQNNQLPERFLMISDNQKNKSLWMVEPVSGAKSKMIFSFEEMGRTGNKYFRITLKTSKVSDITPPDSVSVSVKNTDPSITYICFQKPDEAIIECISKLIQSYVETFEPSEKFGCCHRFKECSAEGKCLHPNLFYAKACWYRKNLESGKVFY